MRLHEFKLKINSFSPHFSAVVQILSVNGVGGNNSHGVKRLHGVEVLQILSDVWVGALNSNSSPLQDLICLQTRSF